MQEPKNSVERVFILSKRGLGRVWWSRWADGSGKCRVEGGSGGAGGPEVQVSAGLEEFWWSWWSGAGGSGVLVSPGLGGGVEVFCVAKMRQKSKTELRQRAEKTK